MPADRPLVKREFPFAIFYNGFLQGQVTGINAPRAAAKWLNTTDNKNLYFFDKEEAIVTVGHYMNSRIERLTTHRFRRDKWTYIGVVVSPIGCEDECADGEKE